MAFARFLFLGIILSFLVGCASSGTLTGGPQDKTPPQIIKEKSGENYQTKFSGKSFKLTFDEFIELRDPIKEIVVSPPLKYIPKTTVRGKELLFAFNEKEVIRENTTYTVNFGKSIQDFHENNSLEDFRFVFSTGEVIDSFKLSGVVLDAQTQKPVENALVLLYDVLDDSVVYAERPFYFGRTNAQGSYSIENIKSDTFRVVAIKDENQNYIFNKEKELFGYVDDYLLFSDTVISQSLNLEISKPKPEYRIFNVINTEYSRLKFKYNAPIEEEPNVKVMEKDVKIYQSFAADSLFIWYQTNLDSFNLDFGFDTIGVKVPDKSTQPKILKATLFEFNGQTRINDSIFVSLSNPYSSIDQSKVSLRDTSGRTLPVTINAVGEFKIAFKANWQEGQQYTFRIDSAAILDFYGNASKDSLKAQFSILSNEKLAEVNLNIKGLDSSIYYTVIFQINDIDIRKEYYEGVDSVKMSVKYLRPDSYQLKIIEDTNRNGRWDPVDFKNRFQAEKVKVFKLEKLKENWTLDSVILYKE